MAVASGIFVQRIDDFTECPICTEKFKNPKILPCVHTFCLGCLEKYADRKSEGDKETCPLCRQEFSIPQGGIGKLPDNFFIGQLVELSKLSVESGVEVGGGLVMCDLCAETNERDPKKVSTIRCTNCSENLCSQCGTAHRRGRATKDHQLVELLLGNPDICVKPVVQQSRRSNFCELHLDKPNEIYCNTCRKDLCVICSLAKHKTHKTVNINQTLDVCRARIQNDINKVRNLLENCRSEATKSEEICTQFLDSVARTELLISRRRTELIRLVDDDTQRLLEELQMLKAKISKEMEMTKEEICRQLTMWESFVRYAEEVKDKVITTPTLIQSSDEVHTRSQQLVNLVISNIQPKADFQFVPSDIDFNIVGTIVEGSPTKGSVDKFGATTLAEIQQQQIGSKILEQLPTEPNLDPSIYGNPTPRAKTLYATILAADEADRESLWPLLSHRHRGHHNRHHFWVQPPSFVSPPGQLQVPHPMFGGPSRQPVLTSAQPCSYGWGRGHKYWPRH